MESYEFIDFQNFDIVKKHTNFSKLSKINKSYCN